MTGSIAQIIPPSGKSPDTPICIDWAHNRIYCGDFNSYLWSYAIPSPLATLEVLNGPTPTPVATWELSYLVVDSTGTLFGQGEGFPTTTTYKIDPVTFASIATFGADSIFDSYPTTFANPLNAASVTVNGVPYLIVKEFNTNAGVIRTDNMTAAGYYANVSTGDQGYSYTTAGKSGATGTVFFGDQSESGHSTRGIYKMTISTGAETYNIASWPTPNPDITSALLVNLAATDVDATWTTIEIQGIGYDTKDDLVIVQVTQYADESVTYLVALNSTTGAIVWNNLLSSFTTTEMQLNRTTNGQIAMLGGSNSTWINGYNGGLTNSINGLGTTGRYNSSDDVTQYVVCQVSYTQDTDTPQPVDGSTPSSFSGYAILGDVWPFNPSTPGLWVISSDTTSEISSGIGDVWMDDSYVDFSNPTVRAKFINPDGTWIYLGFNGQLPTGVSPLDFLRVQTGNPPSDILTGYGQDQTQTPWTLLDVGNDPATGVPYPAMSFDVCPPAPTMTIPFLDVSFETPTHTDHFVTLRWSDDGGFNWSNGLVQTLGLIGEYATSVQFRRIGMAGRIGMGGRTRVFELSWSGAQAEALTGAWVEYIIAAT